MQSVPPVTVVVVEEVVTAARRAKAAGASRFCMGDAWRNPKGKNFERVVEMVKRVRAEGLETCATLGMLDEAQAHDAKIVLSTLSIARLRQLMTNTHVSQRVRMAAKETLRAKGQTV